MRVPLAVGPQAMTGSQAMAARWVLVGTLRNIGTMGCEEREAQEGRDVQSSTSVSIQPI